MPDFQRKLDRADLHIDALDKAIKGWFQRGSYTLVHQVDSETGYEVFHAKIKKPPDPSWALVVGDAVHNLRSALDHIAFAMLAAAHGGTVPAALERQSEFPIIGHLNERTGKPRTDPANDFDSVVAKNLTGLPTKAVEALRELQPYKCGSDFESHDLWLIHDLGRVDKHRRLNIVTAAAQLKNLLIGGTGYFEHFWFGGGEVKNGDKVAEWAQPSGPHLEFNIAQQIAFGQGEPAGRREVVPTLRALREFFDTEVLPALRAFL